MNNRPHNRRTTSSSGKVSVGKGERLGAPSGNRSGGGGNSGCAIAALLGIFALLPKKARRVLIIIIALLAVLYLGYSCLMDEEFPDDTVDEWTDTSDDWSYDETTAHETLIGTSKPESPDTTAPTPSTPSNNARERYTKLVGNGKDQVTVMVYLCGTDLESEYGMATSDLKEMLAADLSDNVNVIVQTGGASKWKNNVVSSSKLQRYQLVGGKLRTLESDLGSKSMTSPDTLSSFIKYCEKNFPADRNFLILWDHGGGTLSGYGYDEKFESSGSMTLDKLNDALADAGCKFDFIGFDACLMATFETAIVANEYADYLVASEELEPGTGWYYTGWLDLISKNTSTPTVDVAKKLIDDYVASNRSTGSKVTLSIIDLAELSKTVPNAFNKFSSSTSELIASDDYQTVSSARASTRKFSEKSKINQIDLIDFCERLGTSESKNLAKALASCVKYNGTNISGANGVSIYFPYESTRNMDSAVRIYNELGIDPEYTDCIRSFASLGAAGQVSGSGSGGSLIGSLLEAFLSDGGESTGSGLGISSLLGGLGGESSGTNISGLLDALTSSRSMPSGLGWLDTKLIKDSAKSIESNSLAPKLKAVTEGGRKLVKLSESDWSLVNAIELNLYIDDGEGYIDLGLDNTFDYDKNGNLICEWDGTWLTLNGHAVAYYRTGETQKSDGPYVTYGKIPVLLNGARAELNVVFDESASDEDYGQIVSATPVYADETDTEPKSFELSVGDVIQPICGYYKYDGSYDADYTLGDSFKLTKSGFRLTNMELDVKNAVVSYRFTDIYGGYYWIK